MRFQHREVNDLIIAGIMISLSFGILLAGGWGIFYRENTKFVTAFGIAFITAGLGFLLHELGHKYVAQRYYLHAEFKAFYPMLFISLALSFFGVIIAAPGAVLISGNLTKEKYGKISMAGPAINIILAILFAIPLLIFNAEGFTFSDILLNILRFGLSINSLLAAFNMIPVMPFDGAKVLVWNKKVYAIALIVSVLLFLLSMAI